MRTVRRSNWDLVNTIRAMTSNAVTFGETVDEEVDIVEAFEQLMGRERARLVEVHPYAEYRIEFTPTRGITVRCVPEAYRLDDGRPPLSRLIPLRQGRDLPAFTVLVDAGLCEDGDPNGWSFVAHAPDAAAAHAMVQELPATTEDVFTGIDDEWKVVAVIPGEPVWRSGGWNRVYRLAPDQDPVLYGIPNQ